jgi:hypothetical protein
MLILFWRAYEMHMDLSLNPSVTSATRSTSIGKTTVEYNGDGVSPRHWKTQSSCVHRYRKRVGGSFTKKWQ